MAKFMIQSGSMLVELEQPSQEDRNRHTPSDRLEHGIGAMGDVPMDLRDLYIVTRVMKAKLEDLSEAASLVSDRKRAFKLIEREEANPLIAEFDILEGIFWKELKTRLKLWPKVCDCGLELRSGWKIVSTHAVKLLERAIQQENEILQARIQELLEGMGRSNGLRMIGMGIPSLGNLSLSSLLGDAGAPDGIRGIRLIRVKKSDLGNLGLSSVLGGQSRGDAIPAELLDFLSGLGFSRAGKVREGSLG